MSWSELIQKSGAADLELKLDLPEDFKANWAPTTEDSQAAWELYNELRTRITVQPLHYMHGDEETALTSVADLFPTSRGLIHKYGSNARQFATLTVFLLNHVVRPFTAEWHKRKLSGDLKNEDARHEFRGKLIELRPSLRQFTTMLGRIAEGAGFCVDSESWPKEIVTPAPAVAEPVPTIETVLCSGIPFDIAFDEVVDPDTANNIRKAERKEILKRRGDPNGQSLTDIAGLAISGGGIRSATFALGVVQRLTAAGVMPHFDYLSTVSGGGYLGSFMSTYLNDNDPKVGLARGQLPFHKPPEDELAGQKPATGEPAPLRHIRGHSNYLFTGGLSNRLNMALLGIYGVFANILIFWPLLAGLLLAVSIFQVDLIQKTISKPYFSLLTYLSESCELQVSLAVILIALLSLIFAPRLFRKSLLSYQAFVSSVLMVCVVLIAWNLIPPLFRQVDLLIGKTASTDLKTNWISWLHNTTFISGAIVMAQRFWASLDSAPAASKIRRFVSMTILGLIGPLFAGLLFLLLGHELIVKPARLWFGVLDPVSLLVLLTFVPLAFAYCLNINQSSLHPFYRRKLSEAFLFKRGANQEQIRLDNSLKLSNLRSENPKAPYHLINCALNAQASQSNALRGRGTDFFLFSQCYSGSVATKYFPTEKWEKQDQNLNLGTAMAISAAAASPYMGVVTIPSANLILTLFNIRLDYWLPVPGRESLFWIARHATPYWLLRQAFGWMTERTRLVNVSDGGHIENLALYELLRRRCRFIVAIDGECDPNLSCGALMQLTRFVKVDFGIDIDIDMSRFRKTSDEASPFHFTLGTIKYPRLNTGSPAAIGHLLYVKLSRTGNEPPGVNYYRLKNKDFPHQSTADQFFDEDQFEAYRALGEHAASDLFSAELLGDQTNPKSLEEWFGKVSHALNDPNRQ